MKIQPRIRIAEPADISQLIDLCEAHAAYEKATYTREGKGERFAKDLFEEHPKLNCLVAESEGTLVGYATYMKQYSTWDTSEYVYLDCLYLKEYARGLRIGAKLIERIKEEAKKLGCTMMQWHTPDFNTGAIKFYKRIGATSKSKERFFLDI